MGPVRLVVPLPSRRVFARRRSMGRPMVKTVPTRTDAYVLCPCGGTATIATVSPIPDEPGHMRHVYVCLECGNDLKFDVAKKTKEHGGA